MSLPTNYQTTEISGNVLVPDVKFPNCTLPILRLTTPSSWGPEESTTSFNFDMWRHPSPWTAFHRLVQALPTVHQYPPTLNHIQATIDLFNHNSIPTLLVTNHTFDLSTLPHPRGIFSFFFSSFPSPIHVSLYLKPVIPSCSTIYFHDSQPVTQNYIPIHPSRLC